MGATKIYEGMKFDTKSFGSAVVVRVGGWDDVLIRFTTTGYEVVTRSDKIRSGSIRDPFFPSVYGVGFVGVGNYDSSTGVSGVHNLIYKTWSGMFKRCYSGSYPTYSDCSVCPDWHNFQRFAAWYSKNHPNDGLKYDLDKDIKTDGNRIYSPDACSFVDQAKNKAKAREKTCVMISPKGVGVDITNVRKFCIENSLSPSCFNEVTLGNRTSHKGWTRPSPQKK